MTNPAIRDRLRDVVSYGREAVETVGNPSADQILSERFREHAVLRTLQVVGEAAAQLLKLDPSLNARAPDLRLAVDQRNALVHAYSKIRMDEVVRIVRGDLPRLVTLAEAILKETLE